MNNLVIIGVSETAWRVYNFVEKYRLFNVIGFAADKEYLTNQTYCGKPVWDIEDLPQHMNVEQDYIFVAILWNHLNADRRNLYERMKAKNSYKFASIISPFSSVLGTIGENCWIRDFVAIQEGAKIGNNVIIKDCVAVGHLTEVKDHVFLSLHSTICGACVIGEQTFVGANATIFDCTNIGEKCLVGAGTCIKRNLPACSLVKVNTEPSQSTKQYAENEIENKWCSTKNIR